MGLERKNEHHERAMQNELYDVVESLRNESFEAGAHTIAQSPRGYRLNRTITPEALRAFGTLDFENKIYDYKGELFFATGSKSSTLPNYSQYDREVLPEGGYDAKWEDHVRAAYSRFNLHNHPVHSWGPLLGSSYQDALSVLDQETEISFIVTLDGIFGYMRNESVLSKSEIVGKAKDIVSRFQNPNRKIRRQLESGATEFFVPFDGDEGDKRRIQLLCQYMNDPHMHWDSIADQVQNHEEST